MTYLQWLLIVSLVFAVSERLLPQRPGQPALRRGVLLDLFYLLFNGHYYAVVTGATVGWFALKTRGGLESASVVPDATWLHQQPFMVQFIIYLVVSDLLQFGVHNLLHRVPFLWSFHKVHHSVVDMDWAGNFRFHWMEIVIYRSLLYLPLLWFGAEPEPLMAVAVFATAWGHFNHSNLRLGIGPLGYLFNSPRMHLWHHDASTEGGTAKNFGVVFSLWDFLFRTAYWPRDRAPERLGFPGIEEMPADFRQLGWPLWRLGVKDPQEISDAGC